MQIHIDWKNGIKLTDSYKLNSGDDYGVYQIYGTHPVYGKNTLLYIGKAASQTFGMRLKQHDKWLYNQDSEQITVYTGRIGSNTPNKDWERWEDIIDIAEKLLIYVHQPAGNSSNIKSVGEIPIDTHVLNWGDHGLLLPEVSAFRYFADDETYFPTYQTLTTD